MQNITKNNTNQKKNQKCQKMSNSDSTQKKNETGEFAIRTKNKIFNDMEELIWEIFGDGSIGLPMTDSGFVNDDGFTLGSTTAGQLDDDISYSIDYELNGVCLDDEIESIGDLDVEGTWKKLYEEYKAIIDSTQKKNFCSDIEIAYKFYNEIEKMEKEFYEIINNYNNRDKAMVCKNHLNLLNNMCEEVEKVRIEIFNKVFKKREKNFYTKEELKKKKKEEVVKIYFKVFEDLVGKEINNSWKSYTKKYSIEQILSFQESHLIPKSFKEEQKAVEMLIKCIKFIRKFLSELTPVVKHLEKEKYPIAKYLITFDNNIPVLDLDTIEIIDYEIFWDDDDYYNGVVETNKILEQELINLSGQSEYCSTTAIIRHLLKHKKKEIHTNWGYAFSAKLHKIKNGSKIIQSWNNIRILSGFEKDGWTTIYPAYVLYNNNLKMYSTFDCSSWWKYGLKECSFPPILSPETLSKNLLKCEFEKKNL